MDLTDIKTIKALLARHGFHFSKSMGQNFLIADWVPRTSPKPPGWTRAAAYWRSGRHWPPHRSAAQRRAG